MTLLPSAADLLLRSLSLDALRGFERAARLQSFTAAADDLNLSQSAVSKQVKALEDTLGVPLFVRGARGLTLTGEGALLLEGVGEALARLAGVVDRLQRGGGMARACVAVTTSPSFASLWLVPRLTAFQARHPEVDIGVDSSTQSLHLERAGVDVAIRLTRAEDLPAGETPLLRQRAMLVAAPELAARIAENGPLALAASKAIVRDSHEWTEADMWDKQQAYITPVFTSQDAREGAAAFAEKRKPNWQGK